MKSKLYILDGHGIIFRSYYAHIKNPLRNSKDENTSAIFGFFQTIKKIFELYKPQKFIIVFDTPGPSFRNEIYKEYKANRQKTPEDLINQIQPIYDILEAMNIATVSTSGVEADDVIASIASQRSQGLEETVVISSDKDLFQIINENTTILRPTSSSSEYVKVDEKWLKKKWNLSPTQILDYLSLVGDSSDNIPGVAGVGEKTALALLHTYKSLVVIYENLNFIKDTWRKKLIDGKDNAFLSHKLITLKRDVAVPSHSLQYSVLQWENARQLFLRYEIFTFAKIAKSSTAHQFYKDNVHVEKNVHLSSRDNADVHSSYYSSPHKGIYKALTSMQEIKKIVDIGLQQKYISIDIETDSLDRFGADLVGISLSVTPHEGFYIPIVCPEKDAMVPKQDVQEALDPLFKNKNCTLIFHNAKFDIPLLSKWGFAYDIKHPLKIFDTLVAGWMCDATLRNYGMDHLSRSFLKYIPISYSSVIKSIPQCTNEGDSPSKNAKGNISSENKIFSAVPLEHAIIYASEDADVTLRLYKHFSPIMKEQKTESIFWDIEMSILTLIMNMEKRGILIDTEWLFSLSHNFEKILQELTKEIYDLCGKEFNIDSTKQLQEVLFTDLKLVSFKKTKTGFSTDVGVLQKLSYQHEVPEKILQYRHVAKLKNTYTDTLPLQIHKHTGRIHTSFHQTGTETGRISSKNPNLQNIPVRDELGKKIRRAFIAPQESILVSADYSQIELVVLAHFSKDKNLVQAFRDGADIHTRTASLLMRIPEDEVSEKQRRIAKSINFGIIYGMSAFRLGNELSIPQKQAREFIEEYFIEFSGVSQFIKDVERQTEKDGYTQTLLGRRRSIYTIHSQNKNIKNAANRMAINTTIQGSAADIVKCAMLAVDEELQKQNCKSVIILQIHDEILLECPETELEIVTEILKQKMKKAYTLSVPLSVSISYGKNWGQLK